MGVRCFGVLMHPSFGNVGNGLRRGLPTESSKRSRIVIREFWPVTLTDVSSILTRHNPQNYAGVNFSSVCPPSLCSYTGFSRMPIWRFSGSGSTPTMFVGTITSSSSFTSAVM